MRGTPPDLRTHVVEGSTYELIQTSLEKAISKKQAGTQWAQNFLRSNPAESFMDEQAQRWLPSQQRKLTPTLSLSHACFLLLMGPPASTCSPSSSGSWSHHLQTKGPSILGSLWLASSCLPMPTVPPGSRGSATFRILPQVTETVRPEGENGDGSADSVSKVMAFLVGFKPH